MENLKNFLRILLDYLPILATLAAGVLFSLVAELDPSVTNDRIAKWNLLILTSVTLVLLIDKVRGTRPIQEGITQIQQTLTRSQNCLQNRDERLDLRKSGTNAQTIDILAWTGYGFLMSYQLFLKEKIKQGCHVRFIMIDKNSDAAQVIVDNASYTLLKTDLSATEARCTEFINDLGTHHGSFELRVTKWLVPYGMIILDIKRPGAILSLGLHPVYLKMSESEQRYITVDASDSQDHFEYFAKQYDDLWDASTSVIKTT